MAWRYATSSAAYYQSGKTKPLTPAQLRKIRDQLADGVAEEIRADANRYIDGEITLEEWAGRFGQTVRESTTAGYLLGSGGVNAQDAATVRQIDRLIADQTGFGQQFIRDLAAGGLSDAQMAARAEQYAGAAVRAYEEAMAYSHGIDLPVYPGDGGTPCHGNCRCAWEIETTDEEVVAWWRTEEDANVCDGCFQRGQDYNPLVIPR